MPGLVALFIADIVVVGTGLTFFSGLSLKLEERVAYGVVLGSMLLVSVGIGLGWIMGVNGASVGLSMVVSTAVAAVGWWVGRGRLAGEWSDLVERRPYELAVLTVPTWIVTVRILDLAYQTDEAGNLLAGHLSAWTDWQAHLTYASSFVYADNIPAELPTAVGNDLGYHWGIDFMASMFVTLGTSVPGGLQLSSAVVAFAFPAVMYLVGVRLLRSRIAAAAATLLFTVFGGLGWVEFVRDVNDGGLGILGSLPNDYTRYQELNYWVENPVTGVMFPQRPTLMGFSALLVVIAALWMARGQKSWVPWVAAGVVVGAMPVFHLFSYGTALGLGIIWALLDRRREWLYFLAPAIVLSLPVALWLLPPERGWELGQWLNEASGRDENFAWFWFKNMGLFLPILLVAQIWGKGLSRTLVIASIPVWLWLIVPNFIVPKHASDFNNTHFFVYVLLLGSFLVAGFLVAVARTWPLTLPVILIAFGTMTLAGALDIWKAADDRAEIWPLQVMSGPAVETAEWARDNTPDDAVFVAGPSHLQSLNAVGGRFLVMGFSGWVYDLGIPDWSERRADTLTILAGEPGAEDLVDVWDVDYVHIGPIERTDFGGNDAFWEERAEIVYDVDGHRIYEVAR